MKSLLIYIKTVLAERKASEERKWKRTVQGRT